MASWGPLGRLPCSAQPSPLTAGERGLGETPGRSRETGTEPWSPPSVPSCLLGQGLAGGRPARAWEEAQRGTGLLQPPAESGPSLGRRAHVFPGETTKDNSRCVSLRLVTEILLLIGGRQTWPVLGWAWSRVP